MHVTCYLEHAFCHSRFKWHRHSDSSGPDSGREDTGPILPSLITHQTADLPSLSLDSELTEGGDHSPLSTAVRGTAGKLSIKAIGT